jgi:hypothetical protein
MHPLVIFGACAACVAAFTGRLSSAERRALPAKDFGLPKERKYPITDRTHAISAKGRALTALRQGHLTEAQYARIVGQANRMLRSERSNFGG